MFYKSLLKSLSAILAIASIPGILAAAHPLVQVKANIGPNPTHVGMYTYTPSKLASPLPLVVAIHGCGGSAKEYFTNTKYATLADTYGFIVVYPNAPATGGCFDVHTNATLTHNGGGDSQGIASMITYSVATYNVSAGNVYITGTDSGAMMANVMAGSYPNLFQAASSYSGVAFGCDYVIYPWNSAELSYQWVTVFNYSMDCASSTLNYPRTNYTMWTYGTNFIDIEADGVGHPVPVDETFDLAWFGIITPTATITDPICTPTPTPTPSVPEYEQCGG
ncbi:hypothetical protein FRB97_002155 [Tulasnella sp. 331]|nr:hypothetical protein FRB97_002155 [Tulasnella sp. 331]KAG8885560.1 hypothetical protein FRB98_001750 [Tulasnella sp. 332]